MKKCKKETQEGDIFKDCRSTGNRKHGNTEIAVYIQKNGGAFLLRILRFQHIWFRVLSLNFARYGEELSPVHAFLLPPSTSACPACYRGLALFHEQKWERKTLIQTSCKGGFRT